LETISIIDGMAMVQIKSAGACTFGELATKYFTSITAPLSQSNIIFDHHWETSIKGGERHRGSTSSLEV